MTTMRMVPAAAALFAAAWTSGALADCPTPAALAPCKACHVLEPGKPSRPTGPNLVGVVGRKAGELADFKGYSEAIRAAREKGLVWTEDNIFNYIADPKGFLAAFNGQPLRNAMAFQLKDEGRRKAAVEGLELIAACQ
ncbi:MAG: cytochrome c family protein [Rhodospirillaceae bacterium]|nr:cytochrome c family protein [Rhodospirillaceae bacterium]